MVWAAIAPSVQMTGQQLCIETSKKVVETCRISQLSRVTTFLISSWQVRRHLCRILWLNHRLSQVRNPGGKTTPQDSTWDITPSLRPVEEIEVLLQSSIVHQSQTALRDIVCFDPPRGTPATVETRLRT